MANSPAFEYSQCFEALTNRLVAMRSTIGIATDQFFRGLRLGAAAERVVRIGQPRAE